MVEITNWGVRMPQNTFGWRWLLIEDFCTPHSHDLIHSIRNRFLWLMIWQFLCVLCDLSRLFQGCWISYFLGGGTPLILNNPNWLECFTFVLKNLNNLNWRRREIDDANFSNQILCDLQYLKSTKKKEYRIIFFTQFKNV